MGMASPFNRVVGSKSARHATPLRGDASKVVGRAAVAGRAVFVGGARISEFAACARSPGQKLASLNPSCVIHREYFDGGAPDRCNTLDNRAAEAEMIRPTVTPRIKQRDNLAGDRIDTG